MAGRGQGFDEQRPRKWTWGTGRRGVSQGPIRKRWHPQTGTTWKPRANGAHKDLPSKTQRMVEKGSGGTNRK